MFVSVDEDQALRRRRELRHIHGVADDHAVIIPGADEQLWQDEGSKLLRAQLQLVAAAGSQGAREDHDPDEGFAIDGSPHAGRSAHAGSDAGYPPVIKGSQESCRCLDVLVEEGESRIPARQPYAPEVEGERGKAVLGEGHGKGAPCRLVGTGRALVGEDHRRLARAIERTCEPDTVLGLEGDSPAFHGDFLRKVPMARAGRCREKHGERYGDPGSTGTRLSFRFHRKPPSYPWSVRRPSGRVRACSDGKVPQIYAIPGQSRPFARNSDFRCRDPSGSVSDPPRIVLRCIIGRCRPLTLARGADYS